MYITYKYSSGATLTENYNTENTWIEAARVIEHSASLHSETRNTIFI